MERELERLTAELQREYKRLTAELQLARIALSQRDTNKLERGPSGCGGYSSEARVPSVRCGDRALSFPGRGHALKAPGAGEDTSVSEEAKGMVVMTATAAVYYFVILAAIYLDVVSIQTCHDCNQCTAWRRVICWSAERFVDAIFEV